MATQPQQLLAQANLAHRAGRLGEAERLYRQVLQEQPSHPDAIHYLAILAHQAGRSTEAEELFQRSLALAPGNAAFHYNYAGMLLAGGRPQDAIPCFQRTLDLDARNVEAWHGLASALQALNCDEEAIACWQRGLASVPGHVASLRGMADSLHSLNRFTEEVEVCRQAYEATGGAPELGVRLAEALSDAGQPESALALLSQLLNRQPHFPDAHCLKGLILSSQGLFDEAASEFEVAVRQAPGFHEAIVHLAGIRKLDPASPLIRRLAEGAQQKNWKSLKEAVSGNFTLGKVYADAGDYDAAFSCYAEGNRLYRGSIQYSTENQARYFSHIREKLGAGFVRRAAACGSSSRLPIFVVGMPRSGTTLVEQILAAHPEVHGGGELTALSAAVRHRLGPDFRQDFAGALAALGDRELAGIGADYLAAVRGLAPSAAHVTDKMPSNFMQIGLIHVLFPQAAIVHCVRDPLDTCVSCFTNLFRNGQLFSYDLKELGEYYRLYAGLMAFWEDLLPGRMYRIEYEKLVSDMEGESRKLLEHCGLVWDPRCLEFNESPGVVRTASVYQVRQPVYQSSVQRWRRYGRHLGPLADALGIPLDTSVASDPASRR